MKAELCLVCLCILHRTQNTSTLEKLKSMMTHWDAREKYYIFAYVFILGEKIQSFGYCRCTAVNIGVHETFQVMVFSG